VPSSSPGRAAVERAVAELIRALGLDSAAEPELAATPARVADLYAEVLSGLEPGSLPDLATFAAPAPASSAGVQRAAQDLVQVGKLPFYSLCVHHLVPFFGRARIAYLPGERILGISGPARVLEYYARRPQLQERLGAQIADHLEQLLAPRGVAVFLEARHLCMEMRGVRRRGVVLTRTLRGALADPAWSAWLGAPGAA
jgi:GTP cyclohydrolase IA